jgi:hypothetical protein
LREAESRTPQDENDIPAIKAEIEETKRKLKRMAARIRSAAVPSVKAGTENTAIYFAPYHSQPSAYLKGSSGRFRLVEQAIAAGEWPYDNGDDPSFYAARRGARLTWGVCREDVRNAISVGSIVVFFSFTKDGPRVLYRLSAVATVAEKLDRRRVFTDRRFRPADYLNVMLRREGRKWKYDEDDHPPTKTARHGDWLWRMAVHGRSKAAFAEQYARIYANQEFAEGDVPIASNYVVFSDSADETYISPNPPFVAMGTVGEHEHWTDRKLERLSVKVAARFSRSARGFLRTDNRSGYVHPKYPFDMPTAEAIAWRADLISTLKRVTNENKQRVRRVAAASVRC